MAKKSNIPTKAGLKKGSEGKNVAAINNYLKENGYIQSDVLKKAGLRTVIAQPEPKNPEKFDDNTEKALRLFQQFVGLPETGELDQPTLDKMQQDRCGVADMVPELKDGKIPSSYVLSGCKWDTNHLRYAFENFANDLTQNEVRNAFNMAFGLWSAVTPLTFSEVGVNDNPEMLIRFGTGNHGGCPFPFQTNTPLAHNFYPPTCGGGHAGNGHYNESFTWSVDSPPSNIDLVTVAAHEIGHGLGLAHSTVQDALMYPYYGGEHRYLHQDDIDGIQAIYGAAEWHHNKKVQRVYTSHHSDNCWAFIQGIGWRKIKPGTVDGTTNMFIALSAARATDRPVSVYIENNTIQIMYL